MGYWEQIKVSNAIELDRRRQRPAWARVDWLGIAAIPLAALYYGLIGAAVLRLLRLI